MSPGEMSPRHVSYPQFEEEEHAKQAAEALKMRSDEGIAADELVKLDPEE